MELLEPARLTLSERFPSSGREGGEVVGLSC